MSATPTIRPEDIQPARKFAKDNPNIFPSKSSFDWLIRNRNTNGLSESGALVKGGREFHFVVPKLLTYFASRIA